MSLTSHYLFFKDVHITAVICSGCLFALRAIAGLAGWRHTMHPGLRYLSYGIDIVLLSAGVCLAFILHQAPLFSGWLTAKLVLLLVYVGLGSVALKRGRTRGGKAGALVAAAAVFLFIVSVALNHDPRGVLVVLAR